MDQILPSFQIEPDRGLTVSAPTMRGALVAAVGIVDRPFEQRRDVLLIDLSGGAGHFAVVGGPHSGKSTVLRALTASLALAHTPREVQFYVLDFGGGTFTSMRDLPHIGGVATRLEVSQVRRTVAEVSLLLTQREQLFTQNGVESMAAYRRMRRAGRFAEDPYGDVFLIVDGWSTIRNEFDDLEPILNDIAARGLTYGVHLVLGASRWMEVRPVVRD